MHNLFNKKFVVFLILMGTSSFVAISIIYPSLPRVSSKNLEKFRDLTATDPLFYDHATDTEFLLNSATEMKKADDTFLAIDSRLRRRGDKRFRDVFPKNWRLWPDEFLATLPYIHIATEQFLKSPSVEGAIVLIDWHERAARLYKKAIDIQLIAMNNVRQRDPKTWEKTIVFLGSGTTPEIVYKDFFLIRKNAIKLTEEIAQRKRCLYFGSCDIGNWKFKIENFAKDTAFVPFNPLPYEILGIKKSDKVEGPFWAPTPCFGRTDNGQPFNHPFFVVEVENKNNGGKSRKHVLLANEQYYHDYSTSASEAISTAPKYESPLRRQAATNDYLCTDLRYLPSLFSKSSNKLNALPHLIQNTLANVWILNAQQRLKKQAFHPLYLLINRSAYSLYFVTFSPAIWRIADMPQFLLRENVNVRKGYMTYHDLISRGVSHEDILRLDSATPIQTLYRKALKQNNAPRQ